MDEVAELVAAFVGSEGGADSEVVPVVVGILTAGDGDAGGGGEEAGSEIFAECAAGDFAVGHFVAGIDGFAVGIEDDDLHL